MNIENCSGERIRVTFGPSSVPIIQASSQAGALTGLGYAMGRCRWAQLQFLRRLYCGCLADKWGKRFESADRRMRSLQLEAIAERNLTALPKSQFQLLDAFAEGVRVAGKKHWFQRAKDWTPRDTMLVAAGLYQDLSLDIAKLLSDRQLFNSLPVEVADYLAFPNNAQWSPSVQTYIEDRLGQHRECDDSVNIHFAGPAAASNSLGLAADRSLLLNDTHFAATLPNALFVACMAYGDQRVWGVCPVGLPVVLSGCNQSLSWGVTNAFIKTASVTTDPKLQDCSVVINGKPLHFSWAAQASGAINLHLMDLMEAATLEQAEEALDSYRGPPLVFTAVDQSRRVSRMVGGLDRGIHCRREAASGGELIVLATANNAVSDELGYGNFLNAGRAQRLSQCALESQALNLVRLQTIADDCQSLILMDYATLIRQTVKEASILQLLDSWHGDVQSQHPATQFLLRFRTLLTTQLLRCCLSAITPLCETFVVYDPDKIFADIARASKAFNHELQDQWQTLVLAAAQDAANGSDNDKAAHQGFKHTPLTYPVLAKLMSWFRLPTTKPKGNTLTVRVETPQSCIAHRLLFDAREPSVAYIGLNGGQRDFPLSRYYCDLQQAFARRQYLRIAYDQEFTIHLTSLNGND